MPPSAAGEYTMHVFNPRGYGSAVAPLLDGAKQNELGPGMADESIRGLLAGLTCESVVAPNRLANRDMAQACLAGLWLRRDFLDESHRISQDLDNPTGSYWHGIMHRREPDYGNSKYWFRRVGTHPVFGALAPAAQELAAGADAGQGADYLLHGDEWDPMRFVDLCQAAVDDPPLAALARQIQRCEWELLFDYCYRQASGT
jgi:hypothetical protein